MTQRAVRVPEPDELKQARDTVGRHLGPTPVVASGDWLLKLECWQPTGSFKVRGALAAMAALSGAERSAGVVAASAGNHGLGVAYAAGRLGVPATVVVPATASRAKVEALRRLPVRLIEHGDGYDAAEAYALRLGGRFVSAYNDTDVIAGQGSVGFELREQVDGPLTVVTPVGGGGLAAGLALWAATEPAVRLVGVESAESRAVSAAMAAGRVVTVPVGETLADGLSGNLEPGSVTAEILARHATVMVAVTEAEIRDAIRFLAREHGLMVEGAGAVAVAALRAGRVPVDGRAVALVTGRNIALPVLAEVLAAEATAGR